LSSPRPPADHVLIGKIVGVHGIKGNIKIVSFAESLALFEEGSAILLCSPDGLQQERTINWVKPHGRGALLSLEGVTSRDLVTELIGCELYVGRDRLPELEPGVYYWLDLIGLAVVTAEGNYLGKIESIIQTGSNDVYVVRHHEQETLVPALNNVVVAIDLDKKEMRVDLPEGL